MGTNRRTDGRRRSSRARAHRSIVPAEPPEIVQLPLSEVIVDEDWNCRDALGSGAPGKEADGPGDEMGDQQLAADIKERGLIHLCRVRRLSDGRYMLTVGFRRMRALKLIHEPDDIVAFTVQRSAGDEDQDEWTASCDNLRENLNRRNLRPFELANKLHRMLEAAPERSTADLAKAVGMSKGYVSQLLSIRRRAAPELWEIFMRAKGPHYGSGITFQDVVHIVRLPKDEQLQAWQKLVAERTNPRSGPRDKKQRQRPGAGKLRIYLRQVDNIAGPEDFQKGVRFGLLVALGHQTWIGYPKPSENKR